MKVLRGWSTKPEQQLTSPFLENNGIFIEFRGGDFCHPKGSTGNWFTPPYFTEVIRKYFSKPIIPFISYRIGNKGGYFGAKAYGVDSEAYKNWLPPEEVYDGSYAIMFSIRPFATINKG